MMRTFFQTAEKPWAYLKNTPEPKKPANPNVDPKIVYKDIYELLLKNPDGIKSTEIIKRCKGMNAHKVILAVQRLVESGVMIWEESKNDNQNTAVIYGLIDSTD
jgi:hypothetical protein